MVHGSYFEIPVQDLQRAIGFYETLFAMTMVCEEIDGNQFAHFPTVDEGVGISGALALGESYHPARTGTRIYLGVDSIAETLARVVELGGEILYPKTAIGAYGFVAEFADSEGNCIALHEGT